MTFLIFPDASRSSKDRRTGAHRDSGPQRASELRLESSRHASRIPWHDQLLAVSQSCVWTDAFASCLMNWWTMVVFMVIAFRVICEVVFGNASRWVLPPCPVRREAVVRSLCLIATWFGWHILILLHVCLTDTLAVVSTKPYFPFTLAKFSAVS